MSGNGQGINAIIMAGGKGTRLKSTHPKVLHKLFGVPLLGHVLQTLNQVSVTQAVVITGHGREQVGEYLDTRKDAFPVKTVVQEPQLGTGHAIQQVKAADDVTVSGTAVILSGDVPLLTPETLAVFTASHEEGGFDLTLMVARLQNPTGYGRVLINKGRVLKIVEEKDASDQEKLVDTVNAGIYALNWEVASPLLDELTSDNAQGEYYLTDLVGLAVKHNLKIGAFLLDDALEMCGINHRLDLAMAHEILNQRAQARLMENGVTILNPSSTMIGPGVTAGGDTVIYPGCFLEGEITLGAHCEIGPNTTLKGTVSVGDNTRVLQSWVTDSRIAGNSHVGPFAQLRDGADIAGHVKIGNFVEVKNARIDEESFVSHLSYIGDAELGKDVNMGAGSITANFDPIRNTKDKTIIEDGVKVGCNSVLVAPVTIGERSCVAAGSVVTKPVAPWDLAIARGRQTAIEGWVKKTVEATQKPAATKTPAE